MSKDVFEKSLAIDQTQQSVIGVHHAYIVNTRIVREVLNYIGQIGILVGYRCFIVGPEILNQLFEHPLGLVRLNSL